MSSINIRFKVVYFYFYQILTVFRNLKIMSEDAHDNLKKLKLFTGFQNDYLRERRQQP